MALCGAGITRDQHGVCDLAERCPCGKKFQSGLEYILDSESFSKNVVEDLSIDLFAILKE